MQELVMIGFADKHRAIEVLPQLQRLDFHWCTDLQNAVAVEVEKDGWLKTAPQPVVGSCIQFQYVAVEGPPQFDRPNASHTRIELIQHYR